MVVLISRFVEVFRLHMFKPIGWEEGVVAILVDVVEASVFFESTNSDLTILHFRYGVRSNTLILSQVVIYSLQILISSKWMESWQMIRWYDLWWPKRRHTLRMMLEVSIIPVQFSSIKRWFLTHIYINIHIHIWLHNMYTLKKSWFMASLQVGKK